MLKYALGSHAGCCCKTNPPCDPCCPTGMATASCCCYPGTCVGGATTPTIYMTYQGSSYCLPATQGCGQCQWSGGGFSGVLSWCYSSGVWTLKNSSGTTLGTTTQGCSFPLSISTAGGTATFLEQCGWSTWPTSVTVTISGVPDPYQYYTTCPSAAAYYTGTTVCNGTFTLDLGNVIGRPCAWGYLQNVTVDGCDRPGTRAVPCPGALCGPITASFSITASLVCQGGAGYAIVITFGLLGSPGSFSILGGQSASGIWLPASSTCSWPYSVPMQATLQASRFGSLTAPTVTLSVP